MSIKKLTALAETEAQSLFQEGLALVQQNKFEEADKLLRKAFQINPDNPDVLTLLGIQSYLKKDYQNALFFLNQANAITPNSVHILSNLGLVLNALAQFDEALACFDASIRIEPNIPEIYNNRGNALKGLKKNRDAIASYDKAISLRPNYAEALSNKGILLLESGANEQAISLLKKAVSVNPNLAESLNSLGNALTELKQFDQAFEYFEHALAINPTYLDACLNFGNSLKKAKQYDGAIRCYEQALKINPSYSKSYYLLGELYFEIGKNSQAKECYAKAITFDPKDLESQYALTVSQIPQVYENYEEIVVARASFKDNLDKLQAAKLEVFSPDIVVKAIGKHPFYLSYQESNNKSLLSQFGQICFDHGQVVQSNLNLKPSRAIDHRKIRIGIVSKFFCNHPVWHAITKGWVKYLNPDLFEIYVFHTGHVEDDETAISKSRAYRFFKGALTIENFAQEILDQDLDALLFPEIGMDAASKALACLRLAPLQAVSWGHPETSGLPNVDFFLSGDLLEPNSADQHYSEKLIRLPNFGTYFEYSSVTSKTPNLDQLNIDQTIPILLCAGSPSKYLPNHDNIFIEIAKRLGKCQFVFFNFDDYLSSILEERLRKAFSNAQLDSSQYFKFIPFQNRENFYGLLKTADLYLDTVGFSGFNTAMQSIQCDLPIITVEGKSLRARLASGILTKLGLTEFICKSSEDYVDLAVELVKNQNKLMGYKEIINANKMIAFNDITAVKGLENFLIQNLKR